MSIFSGKCDFCDHLWIYGNSEEEIEELLQKTKAYIHGKDGRNHQIKMDCMKDAVKYYPYIIGIGSFSKERHYIELSSESFIDSEEKEHLQWDIDDVKAYWRRCKRNKTEFDEDACYQKLKWRNDDYLKEIISRIARDGNKATFDDIHKPLWEHYRREWYEEMLRYGYSQREAFAWCFNEQKFWIDNEVMKKRLGEYYEEENKA